MCEVAGRHKAIRAGTAIGMRPGQRLSRNVVGESPKHGKRALTRRQGDNRNVGWRGAVFGSSFTLQDGRQVDCACIRLGGGMLSRSASVVRRGAIDEIGQVVGTEPCRIFDLSSGGSFEVEKS